MVRNPPPPPPEDPYTKFLHEYIEANPTDRIDILSCSREVAGLLFFTDEHISTLSNFKVQRLGPSRKEIQGTTGTPDNYFIFKDSRV